MKNFPTVAMGIVLAPRLPGTMLIKNGEFVSVAGPKSQNHVSLPTIAAPVTIAGGDV